jgi:anti-anti-sigma regulatory factor
VLRAGASAGLADIAQLFGHADINTAQAANTQLTRAHGSMPAGAIDLTGLAFVRNTGLHMLALRGLA